MTTNGDGLWAVTACFSPVADPRRVENYRRFRAALSVPLATIEASFADRWDLSDVDADVYVRVRDADVLWQKERLLNILLQQLPPTCRYVAWLDADVLMTTPDWSRRAVSALEQVPLVQLFSTLRYLDRDGRQDGAMRASAAAAVQAGMSPAEVLGEVTNRTGKAASPGMAWAAQRELLERHGFYDTCIIGGGDTALACAAYGVPEIAMRLHCMNAMQCERYARWAGLFHRDVAARVGVVEGGITHLWHGELASRRAGQRHADLAAHSFDPLADLAPGRDGAWRWASNKPDLHALLTTYFVGRAAQD